MVLPKREQVFVSSTYEDLKVERQVVTQRLLEIKCIPAGMELFPAASDDKWDLIRRVIEESDYYLLILGGRYGSLVSGLDVSYTEREYQYARSLNIPVLAFIREDDGLLAARSERKPRGQRQLAAFRDRVKSDVAVNFWSTPDQLGGRVTAAVIEARQIHPAEGWIKASEVRAYLGLDIGLVEALRVAGIVEISPGLGGVRDHRVFDRLRTSTTIDVFANTAYHFLSLNETSLIEALSQKSCRFRLCVSETMDNPIFRDSMYDARTNDQIPLSEALCPSKDIEVEIANAVYHVEKVIFPEATRFCARNGIDGPGTVEVYRYSGVPTCGMMFIDDHIGRRVPYVPFSGSNQSPAFVFERGSKADGRLFEYLWGKYLDVLESIGKPTLVLSSAD